MSLTLLSDYWNCGSQELEFPRESGAWRGESLQAEPSRGESLQSEPYKEGSLQPEPCRGENLQSEPARGKSLQCEPWREGKGYSLNRAEGKTYSLNHAEGKVYSVDHREGKVYSLNHAEGKVYSLNQPEGKDLFPQKIIGKGTRRTMGLPWTGPHLDQDSLDIILPSGLKGALTSSPGYLCPFFQCSHIDKAPFSAFHY